MHNTHHEPPDTSKGFEQSDLSFSGIAKGVLYYFVFTIAVGIVVLIYMWIIGANRPKDYSVAGTRRVPQAPYPMLQNNITARTDIWNLRARENYLLSNTTWVDQKHGIVRVPIDTAITLAATKGSASLSAGNPNTAAAPENGTVSAQGQQSVGKMGQIPPAVDKPQVPHTGLAMPPNKTAGSESIKPSETLNNPPRGGKLNVPKGASIAP